MAKKSDSGFPIAAAMAKQAKGETQSIPSTKFPAPSAANHRPVRIKLGEFRQIVELGGSKAQGLLDNLAFTARYGDIVERRGAGLELRALARITSGDFDKFFCEEHPVILVDTDGDCYQTNGTGSIKGERLPEVKDFHSVPVDLPFRPDGETPEMAGDRVMDEKTTHFTENLHDYLNPAPTKPPEGPQHYQPRESRE